MNALFQGIWNRFSTTTGSGFYNDVSGRMYHYKAPQEATFPYCVYFPVSDLNDVDFGEEREEILMQFNIFSRNNSALEAGTLLESLKTMFDDCNLTVTGWRHIEFSRNLVYPMNDYDQVPPIHGYAVEYDVLLEKTR
jgi:hypothetical protein